MISGYPPTPAEKASKPAPPLSPADKIPTSKEQELATIHVLNKRLKNALDKDKKENETLEQKRLAAKDAKSKEQQELEMVKWKFEQTNKDLLGHKETWAGTEADLYTKVLNLNDKKKYVDYLLDHKTEFQRQLITKLTKKTQKLANIERRILELSSAKNGHELINELNNEMISESEALKQSMVELARLESSQREAQHEYALELVYADKWEEKCAPYAGLDPTEYAKKKEAQRIKAREKELETRFAKIFDDTKEQMRAQSQQQLESAKEKQRQSAAEKQNVEALLKELKKKKLATVNAISQLENELAKLEKEVQHLEDTIVTLLKELPNLEQLKRAALDKKAILDAEMSTLGSRRAQRDAANAALSQSLKEKTDQAVKAKQEEDLKIADLRARLESKKHQLEEANIGLFPEISKYRGLVDVVEVKLTPQLKKQKRTTL